MEKGTKQGVSGGILIIIMILCITLGIATGYIIGNKLLKKEETRQETNKDKTDKQATEDKNSNTKRGTSRGINVEEKCKEDECTLDFDLSNNIVTKKVHIERKKIENSLETTITINDEIMKLFNDYKNDYYTNFGIITKIGIFDNGIIVIEHHGSATPTSLDRTYYKNNKIITTISDFVDGAGYLKEDIVSKTVTYHSEGGCYDNDTKRDETEHIFTLNDDGTYETKDVSTKTKGCAGQS